MRRFVTAIGFLSIFVTSGTLLAQMAPAGGVVIGSGNFSPIVKDLNKLQC